MARGFIYLPPGTPPPPPIAPTPPVAPTPTAPTPPECEGSRPDFARVLDVSERDFARNVFGPTLPPWETIAITNGLGAGGRPWTNDGPFFRGSNPMVPSMRYAINLGSVAFSNLASPSPTFGLLCDDFGRICDLFVHEMTHVWQAFNDSNWTMARSFWAQSNRFRLRVHAGRFLGTHTTLSNRHTSLKIGTNTKSVLRCLPRSAIRTSGSWSALDASLFLAGWILWH